MERAHLIEKKLREAFQPEHLEVTDESHLHRHHPGGGVETHFRVLIVSRKFNGMPLVERQRKVFTVLADELKSGLHALAQRTLTPEEWSGD